MSAPEVEILHDFGTLEQATGAWDHLLASTADSIFLTPAWQREWWRAFGGERLLLAVARRAGRITLIAPLFAEGQMIFLVGSGGSDYLDVVGRAEAKSLAAMLAAAREQVPGFAGIRLFHLRKESPTTAVLPQLARHLGLELYDEGGMGAPYADLASSSRREYLLERSRIKKEEARMRRAGPLKIGEARVDQAHDWLDLFFEQHAARWRAGGGDGILADARRFYRAVVPRGIRDGWLRFTRLSWCGAPVAFDISLIRGTRQITYLVSRDATVQAFSPGGVLRRHVVKAAVESGVRIFDFGLGEEPYKLRAADGIAEVRNWLLCP